MSAPGRRRRTAAAPVGRRRIILDGRDGAVAMPHGSGLYVRRLAEALATQVPAGVELRVIGRGHPGPEAVFEQLTLPALLRARRADLLHGPDSFLPLVRPCAGVLTVHDLAFLALPGDMPAATEAKYRLLVPAAARSAEAVICPSAFTAEDLVRRCRVDPARIHVIAEAPALPRGDRPVPAGPYLLAAGDLRPKKNLGVLVQAFRRLHADGFPHRLILAGADLGAAPALGALAGRAPVHFSGFLPDPELDALIRGADAVVVPGVYEGFGLVALDAMARARPTVLARAGALPEVGGEAALYFEPSDVGELVAVLTGLLGSSVNRAARSVAAAERAAQFSWAATAAATWAVYQELL
ncbi:glycosyltransferase family 1 protein [Conexibacter sp. DBS9H8]|uniref:glycosyltransferase family 4 protein n=1 Tax=Conexibacter sp. DBS9H8 TaxID=2937801 RepID=UPI00200D5477|nr:glycosyltransferase family 1 protein [Conexibacter sp. DBS9H8]